MEPLTLLEIEGTKTVHRRSGLLPDALVEVSGEKRYAAFEEIGRQLMIRVCHFLLLIAAEQAPQTRTAERFGGHSTLAEKCKLGGEQ